MKKKRFLFDPQWFEKHQNKLLRLINTPFGRWFFRIHKNGSSVGKKKVTRIAPNFIEWKEKNGLTAREFRTHNKFSKRILHGLYPVWYGCHIWDTIIANPLKDLIEGFGKEPAWNLNLGFDTLTVYPDYDGAEGATTTDGNVRRYLGDGNGVAYATLRGGAGTDAYVSGAFLEASLGTDGENTFYQIYRMVFLFDTSALPNDCEILEATISLYGSSKSNNMVLDADLIELSIVSSNPDSNTTLIASDFSTLGTTEYGNMAYADFDGFPGSYNDISLNETGIGTISKTGISKFGGRLSSDTSGTAPVYGDTYTGLSEFGHDYARSSFSAKTADTAGTTNDPKLVILYQETFDATIETKGRIQKLFNQVITGKARIEQTRIKTVEVNARIEGKVDILAKGRIQKSFQQTISNKGRILKNFTQTIISKANILGIATIQAKGNIFDTSFREIQAKSRVGEGQLYQIEAKGDIKKEKEKSIEGKASLFVTTLQTITSLGRITIETEGFLQAKASICRNLTQSIQSKANIYNPLLPPTAFVEEIAKTVRQFSPKIEIQWDGVTWTDESAYFLSASANEKLAKLMGEGIAATLDVELDNTSERFTPGNAASPIYQYLVPRTQIRVFITAGGYDYRLFTGYIKNIHPNTRSRLCNLECFDNQVLVYNQVANGIVYEDKRSDELLAILVGLLEIDSLEYDFEVGQEVINFGYFEDRNVWPVMGEIAVAERGRVFFNRYGILNFWNRDKLHNQSIRSIVPDISLAGWISDLDYSVAEHEIKNVVTVKAIPRANAGVQVVWSSGNAEYLNPYTDTLVWIPANNVQVAWLELADPCTTFITPVRNTDFTANSAQDGSGDDLSNNIEVHEFINYGNAVFVNVINTGATDAYLTKFQVRGNPVRPLKWIKVTAKEDSSISRYGRQEFIIENNFIDDESTAVSIAEEELWRRKEAINLFRIKIIGIPYLLCGDIVNIEYTSGSYKNYMIDELTWTFDDGGFNQTLTLVNPYIFPSIQRVSARANIT